MHLLKKIADKDKVLQLLECCGEQLRRDLTRAAGGTLSTKPDNEVMEAIHKLAVREENTMVVRFALHQMVQEGDEPVRNFGARIKGQADVCKYNTECSNCDHSIDYTDEILRDVLVRGLADTERSVDKLTQAIGANALRSS